MLLENLSFIQEVSYLVLCDYLVIWKLMINTGARKLVKISEKEYFSLYKY